MIETWVQLKKNMPHVKSHWRKIDFMQLINKHCQRHNGPILKFKILTKSSFRILTKIQLHNLYKTSAAKWWTNSSFKILPELQLQNLDQPCAQSLNKSLALWTNFSFQICNKLLPTRSLTPATVTASTSFEYASSHARVTSIKFTKQEWVS